jgi:hypothetical protein
LKTVEPQGSVGSNPTFSDPRESGIRSEQTRRQPEANQDDLRQCAKPARRKLTGRQLPERNPTFSDPFYTRYNRRGARVVESGSLLRSCTGNGTEGSNPSLSVFLTPLGIRSRVFADPLRKSGQEGRDRIRSRAGERQHDVAERKPNPSLSVFLTLYP